MKKINIPIHKHTPKRYRQSRNELNVGLFSSYPAIKRGVSYLSIPLVTDLQRVNPTTKIRLHKDGGFDYVNDVMVFSNKLTSVPDDFGMGYLADEFRKAGFEPYPTKKLGIFSNIKFHIKRRLKWLDQD